MAKERAVYSLEHLSNYFVIVNCLPTLKTSDRPDMHQTKHSKQSDTAVGYVTNAEEESLHTWEKISNTTLESINM